MAYEGALKLKMIFSPELGSFMYYFWQKITATKGEVKGDLSQCATQQYIDFTFVLSQNVFIDFLL